MGALLSRSVELQICNNTQDITLMNARTFIGRGRCSKRPQPALSPGSSDAWHFCGDPLLWGVVGTTCVSGILVYEAKSFSLAIYCYNPHDHNYFSPKLGLELSPGKAHLGDLRATYRRMAEGTYSNFCQDIKFTRVVVAGSHGTAQLSHGPVKVTATMSDDTSSRIKVVLEEEKESGEEAKGGRPWDVKGGWPKRSETSRDILQDMMGSPGGLALLTMPLNEVPERNVTVKYQGEKEIWEGLLDSRADASFINLKYWPRHWPLWPTRKAVMGVGGEMPAKESPMLSVTIDGKTVQHVFLILPLSHDVDCIIGRDIMDKMGIVPINEHPLY